VTHSEDNEFWYFAEPDQSKLSLEQVVNDRLGETSRSAGSINLIKNIDIADFSFALRRLYDHNPNIKLILTLRDPVDRAISSYWYAVQRGWESNSIEQAFELETKRLADDSFKYRQNAYRFRSNYINIIERINAVFSKKQLLITIYEKKRIDSKRFYEEIFNFLDLSPFETITRSEASFNRTIYRSPLINEIYDILTSSPVILRLIPRFVKDTANSFFRNLGSMSASENIAETPPTLKAELIQDFEPMVKELSLHLNEDLSLFWKNFTKNNNKDKHSRHSV